LRNVFLVGITVLTCPQCKGESPVIPKIAQLHEVIARSLLTKPALLSGEEIRFLRKHAGVAQKAFADLLGMTQEHLSRVETGKTEVLGPAGDKLVRAVVAQQLQAEDLAKTVLLNPKRLRRQLRRRPTFAMERNRWREVAA